MARLQKSETFGGRLTEAREEAERWDGSGIGYTQGELADLLAEKYGVTIGRSYISELERSWQQNKMPSMEVGRALAQACRVNFAWLALLTEEKDLPDAAGDVAWSETTNALMAVVDKWPEVARQALLAAARAVAPYVRIEDKNEALPDTTGAGEQDRLDYLLSSNGSAQQGDQPQAQSKRKVRR